MKSLTGINTINKTFTQPTMNKIFQDNFEKRKNILIDELSELVHPDVLKRIKDANNSFELANVVERFQTGLFINNQLKAMKLNTVKNIDKEISIEWENRCCRSDSIYAAIQKALVVNEAKVPEIIEMQDFLLKEYGIKASLGDNINKAKEIVEACKVWKASGEDFAQEIIVSKCMPGWLLGGQVLNQKTILFSGNNLVEKIFKILTKFDKLDFLHLKTPNYSTTSKQHVLIHEFSHVVQPKRLRSENIELPEHLQKAAKKVSKYASGLEGIGELYAELKTKNTLAKEKMKKEEVEILNFLESLK